jgi:hypothetical protein
MGTGKLHGISTSPRNQRLLRIRSRRERRIGKR